MTLDHFVAVEQIAAVGLLKIDTEGAEVDILRGASQTLDKTESVLIECHSSALETQTRRILNERGFQLISRRDMRGTSVVSFTKP